MADFEWDDAKRRKNLEKHGFDFEDAVRVFANRTLEARSSFRDEERWIAIGLLDGREVAVVYTWRQGIRRIISVRRARSDERRRYYESNAR